MKNKWYTKISHLPEKNENGSFKGYGGMARCKNPCCQEIYYYSQGNFPSQCPVCGFDGGENFILKAKSFVSLAKLKFLQESSIAITVCDREGTIIYLNNQAVKIWEKDGGQDLIGKSIFDCHPEPAKIKLKELLRNPVTNCYTVEKVVDGIKIKKLIRQMPWIQDGECLWLIELSFEIPFDLPHFVR